MDNDPHLIRIVLTLENRLSILEICFLWRIFRRWTLKAFALSYLQEVALKSKKKGRPLVIAGDYLIHTYILPPRMQQDFQLTDILNHRGVEIEYPLEVTSGKFEKIKIRARIGGGNGQKGRPILA